MALQIRRGPSADRLAVTFLQGELIYDTDEGAVYIGDGATPGGVPVTSFTSEDAQDAAASMLTGGTHANIAFTYNDSSNTIDATVSLDGGILEISEDTTPQLGGNLDLSGFKIVGAGNIELNTGDITLSTGNIQAGQVTADLVGSLTGNVLGNLTGNVDGDVTGDLTGDIKATDGSVVLDNGTDGTDATFAGTVTGDILTESITAPALNPIVISSDTSFTGTVTVGGDGINVDKILMTTDVTGQVPQTDFPLQITVTDNSSDVRPVALKLVAETASTIACGPTIDFSILDSLGDPVGDPGLPIAQIVSLSEPDNVTGGLEVRVWDHAAGAWTTQISTSKDLTIINNKLSLYQHTLFSGDLESLPIAVTDSEALTLASYSDIVTYGNVKPGLEDDGEGNPVPSGTYNLGAQTAAYKNLYLDGVTITSPPITSTGAAGDIEGMVAFDSTYIYYCTADHDGSTAIWTRATLSYATW
jgi:hypothetical protein